MKKILFFTLSLLFMACASQKVVYVPTEAQTIIEYRDSVVHIIDTIKIEVPRESIKEVMPLIDTSRLETSVAWSEAYIDTLDRKLHHRLENKQTALKAKVDTIVKIEYVDKIIERAVIQEVEVPVKYVPTIYKYSLWFSIAVIAFILGFVYFKINSKIF